MKKWVLGLGAAIALGVAGVGVFVGYMVGTFPPTYPGIEAPNLAASTDPAVIARGQYLFEAVAHCTICHTREEDFIGKANVAGMAPSGGHEWVLGPMGTLRSANITSDVETGIGGMSDADLARVIKHAVKPNGEPALMMVAVGPMSDEDVVAVMSYIRTIPPVRNQVAPSEITMAGKVMLPLLAAAYIAPKPNWEQQPYVPEGELSVTRGAYLANGPAFCFLCHSEPQLSPELGVVGPRFAGAVTADPDPHDETMEIIAPNLSPDPETGHITRWSEDDFVARMRGGRSVTHSPMPWENFRLMSDADLRSIYRYLQTVPPTKRVTGPSYRKAGWSPE